MKNVLLIHTGVFILNSFKNKKRHYPTRVTGTALTDAAPNLKVRKTYTPHTTVIIPQNVSDKMEWTLSVPDRSMVKIPHRLMPPPQASFSKQRQRGKSMLTVPPKAPRFGAAMTAKMITFFISMG